MKTKIKIPEILENNHHGKNLYLKLYNEFIDEKTLSRAEIFCFESYCVEYGNYINLELELQSEGFTIKASNGTIMPNPKYTMKQASFNSMMKAAIHLGLTPKSRVKKASNVKLTVLEKLRSGIKST